MTTQKDKEGKDTSVPEDKVGQSDVEGRAVTPAPNTSVPQDGPEANTSVPQDLQ